LATGNTCGLCNAASYPNKWFVSHNPILNL
jgi:hypothetical protein